MKIRGALSRTPPLLGERGAPPTQQIIAVSTPAFLTPARHNFLPLSDTSKQSITPLLQESNDPAFTGEPSESGPSECEGGEYSATPCSAPVSGVRDL